MSRGAFITLEGGEGVGKSTAMGVVEATLRARDIAYVATREPGGTPLGETVRSWILDGDHGALSANVETLLMFAARAAHIESVIQPTLAAGDWVVCDRFTDATFAYQGGGRGASMDLLRMLANEVQGELTPDLTLLLDAPVEVGIGRIAQRELDHFERAGGDFLKRVRDTYLKLAADAPDRIKLIDANRPLDAVNADIAAAVTDFCGRFASAA